MTQTTCNMMWLRCLLVELSFSVEVPMSMHCDNLTVIFITNNPTFHEHTKHIEIDCHYVRDMVIRGIIDTLYTLYAVKTLEGNYALLMYSYNWIGGCDHHGFLWSYNPDGSRTFRKEITETTQFGNESRKNIEKSTGYIQ